MIAVMAPATDGPREPAATDPFVNRVSAIGPIVRSTMYRVDRTDPLPLDDAVRAYNAATMMLRPNLNRIGELRAEHGEDWYDEFDTVVAVDEPTTFLLVLIGQWAEAADALQHAVLVHLAPPPAPTDDSAELEVA